MDAIQKDVDEVLTEDKELEEQLSRHQSEIERIAESVQEGHENFDGDQEDSEPTITEEEYLNPLSRKDDKWYVSAKVDGAEVDVPWDDVVAQYQKNSSGDKRLQEAAEKQRELADYEAKLNAYRAHLEAQRASHLRTLVKLYRHLRTRLMPFMGNTTMPFSKAMKVKQILY